MNSTEAKHLISLLVAAFPSARVGDETVSVYESGIADLGAQETQAAIGELIHSSKFLPSVADIRGEVVRGRRLRHEQNESERRRLRLTRDDGSNAGPRPEAWGMPLSRMLATAERHREIARKWYAERGKPLPPEPAQPFLDLAKVGASGGDVRERFQRDVLPDQDEQERRHP